MYIAAHTPHGMNKILYVLCLLFCFAATEAQTLQLVSQPVTLKSGLSFNLRVAKGYRVAVAAEGLHRPRFFAKSPDGRLFVTDMHDRSDNKNGKILILNSFNIKEHRFEAVTEYLGGLHNPNQVAFYNAGTNWYLYIAETGKLTQVPFKAGDVKPSATGRVLTTLPDYGLSYKYGGWHLTRSLAFHNNKLYVSVGSSCNACVEKETVRASILQMNPDGSNVKVYASGVRNAVGITWAGNQLWVSNMGRDLIGPDKPQDQLMKIDSGVHYGWPYYYQYNQTIEADKQFKDSARPKGLKPPPVGLVGIKAHSAPLGIAYVSNFTDPALNNRFLIALHGSTSVWRQRGNEVVLVTGRDKYEPFVTGFLQGKTEDKRYGRPCDIYQWDDHSFFISDDKNGVIYYVWKE